MIAAVLTLTLLSLLIAATAQGRRDRERDLFAPDATLAGRYGGHLSWHDRSRL